MFSTLSNKLKSLFSQNPETGNSRKRKRPVEGSDDPDCEIVEVKRAKNSEPEHQQLGYNFFAKMADWVRNKKSWDKMFDFRTKDSSSVKNNGQFSNSGVPSSYNDRVNGNGEVKQNIGQGQPEVKDHGQPGDPKFNWKEDQRSKPVRHTLNGDGREIPPDNLARKPVVNKKSYASVVSGSNKGKTQQYSQANGDGSSSQRTLFPQKKQDIRFTANETIRLDEKARYKMLLQQYTQVPLKSTKEEMNNDSWPSLDRSRAKRLEDTLLSGEARKFVTKIDTSKSKETPRYKMTPSQCPPPSGTTLNHVSLTDVIKSASFNVSHIQSPTSIPQLPLLESTRVPEVSLLHDTIVIEPQTDDVHISPEKDHDLSIRKKSPTDYRKCQYLSENWRADFMSKYKSSAQERERKIKETETRAKVLEEMRKRKDDEMARRIELQMRISVKEPAVTEDLPVELSDEEEGKEEILPDLTPEMDDIINKALRGHPPGEVLVEGYRLQITRGDIATLAGLNWLNDEVINFYMNMLMERGEKDNFPKCYAFNTFFYPKIMSGGQSTVRRWTRKVDIFSHDYIIIPVHLGMHWCLCIVDFKKKMIRYYDSMGGQNIKCLNAVKQYLCDECKDKKNQQFDFSGWSTEIAEDIPQQMNGSDCGMFACKFAEYVTREAKISFEQKHMPYFRRRMVYEIVTKTLLQ